MIHKINIFQGISFKWEHEIPSMKTFRRVTYNILYARQNYPKYSEKGYKDDIDTKIKESIGKHLTDDTHKMDVKIDWINPITLNTEENYVDFYSKIMVGEIYEKLQLNINNNIRNISTKIFYPDHREIKYDSIKYSLPRLLDIGLVGNDKLTNKQISESIIEINFSF